MEYLKRYLITFMFMQLITITSLSQINARRKRKIECEKTNPIFDLRGWQVFQQRSRVSPRSAVPRSKLRYWRIIERRWLNCSDAVHPAVQLGRGKADDPMGRQSQCCGLYLTHSHSFSCADRRLWSSAQLAAPREEHPTQLQDTRDYQRTD